MARSSLDAVSRNLGPALVTRVTIVVGDMGWVDPDFEYSTVCPILLGQMRIWQNWLGR